MAILPLEMTRKQLFISGVKCELLLAPQSSERDFGFVPHLQHMPVTAIPESRLPPAETAMAQLPSGKPLGDLNVGNECSSE